MLLRLAWRNLWRNTKRTLILTSSVFFAVVLSLAMRSMQHGQYDMMINFAVSTYTGAVQVQGTGYWEKKTLEKSITMTPEEMAWIAGRPHVTHVAPRLETAMLVAHGAVTKVGPVIGIDPAAEDAMTGLRKRLLRGAWPSIADSGVLLGRGLARALGVDVGDSVVLYGQGWRDVTAAAQARVLGILGWPIPDVDNSMVYAPLGYAQWLTSAPDRITAVAMLVDDAREVDNVAADLRSRFHGNRTVMTWAEMQPEMLSGIAADSASGILMLIVLYIIIGFGILGTIMMMAQERRREFGMLVALGMRRRTLAAVTTIETIMIALLGALSGIAFGIPLLVYLSYNPIPISGDLASAMANYGIEPFMPFSRAAGIFVNQGITVLVIGLVCALYPILSIRKIQPVSAMR